MVADAYRLYQAYSVEEDKAWCCVCTKCTCNVFAYVSTQEWQWPNRDSFISTFSRLFSFMKYLILRIPHYIYFAWIWCGWCSIRPRSYLLYMFIGLSRIAIATFSLALNEVQLPNKIKCKSTYFVSVVLSAWSWFVRSVCADTAKHFKYPYMLRFHLNKCRTILGTNQFVHTETRKNVSKTPYWRFRIDQMAAKHAPNWAHVSNGHTICKCPTIAAILPWIRRRLHLEVRAHDERQREKNRKS